MSARAHPSAALAAPNGGAAAPQMDIETGKTVAEWGFRKDGTEVSMKDLVNDTKGAARCA